ncbi:hypothetical protein ACQCVE_17135 [Metabacillus sp. 113a]|uniref:hypothetical protein n=1 Tax=Metabacillus sp. 113a TaxID=3404706 RepID=UPI003CF07937
MVSSRGGFIDDKLDNLQEFTIQPDPEVTATEAKLNQVNIGMTYEETTEILGGEGVITQQSGGAEGEFKGTIYVYKSEEELRNIFLEFQDGKLLSKNKSM